MVDYNWLSLLASLECSNIIPVWPVALSPGALRKAPLFVGNCMSAGTLCGLKFIKKQEIWQLELEMEIDDQYGVWMQNRV